MLTCVYAHNDANERRELWHIIYTLSESINQPWIVIGDFNCVLYSNEKEVWNIIPTLGLIDFRNCIEKT